jgi:hypothetical protein
MKAFILAAPLADQAILESIYKITEEARWTANNATNTPEPTQKARRRFFSPWF